MAKQQQPIVDPGLILDLDDEKTEETKIAIAAGVSACHGGALRAFWHEGRLYTISMTIAHRDAIDHHEGNGSSLKPYSFE